MVVSHIASVSSVETRLVAATSPRRKNPARDEFGEDEDELQLLEESEEEEDEKDTESKEEMAKDNIGEMTTMSYTELESATPQQEDAPSLEMMYETTLKPQVTFSDHDTFKTKDIYIVCDAPPKQMSDVKPSFDCPYQQTQTAVCFSAMCP